MTDSARTWHLVHRMRQDLLADLAPLPASAWSTPSLCPGWDVHDVVAHLVDTARTGRLDFVRRLVAARFDFDLDNARGIERERRDEPAATLDALRAVIPLTRTPPAPLATRLVEAVVHGEDVRRPLGLVGRYPSEAVTAALALQLRTSVATGGGRDRVAGLRVVIDDAPVAVGSGPLVQGSALDLLLAVSGRPVPDGALRGPGASQLGTAGGGAS